MRKQLPDSQLRALRDERMRSCGLCGGSGQYQGQDCQCLIEWRIWHWLLEGGFGAEHLIYDLSDLSKIDFRHGQDTVQYYVTHIESVSQNGLSLFIQSEGYGRGKTSLATIIAKEFARYYSNRSHYKFDFEAVFVDVREFMDYHKSFTLREQFEKSWDADLWVLDELGKELTYQRDREETISLIERFIRYRRKISKPTIYTANLSSQVALEEYGQHVGSLLEIAPSKPYIDGSIFKEVVLKGADFRQRGV